MLTKRMQIQAIADRLAGFETTLKAHNLTEPWRTVMVALERAEPGQAREALLAVLKDHPDREVIMGALYSTKPGAPLSDCLSLVEMDETGLIADVEWLWPNWLPLAMLSLLTAYGGAGKSIVALDLCRRIIANSAFPDGAPVGRPGATAIYVDAEIVPQAHNTRAKVWAMDRSRVYLMLPQPDELFIDLNQLSFQDRLVEMAFTVNPTLIVVDSLSASSIKGLNAKEDVMLELGFLNRLAQELHCGMLLIHHLRKPGGNVVTQLTQHDVMGSAHIVNASRSVLGLSIIQTGPQLDLNGPRRLEVLKTNFCRYPKPIGVEFVEVHPDAPELRYGEAPQPYELPNKVDTCADWLLATLQEQEEPIKPKEVVAMAAEAGHSRASVYRARDFLETEGLLVNVGTRPYCLWALAERGESE